MLRRCSYIRNTGSGKNIKRPFTDLKVRVVKVVDLMTLQPQSEHPHGLSDKDFDDLFTTDKPIIFAFHGFPLLIHRLTYRGTNHAQLLVRGLQRTRHYYNTL